MDPVKAISSVFANYANFSGRAPRSEYWWFVTLLIAAQVVAFAIMSSGQVVLGGIIFLILVLTTVVPSLSVQVRRLHDMDRSAWWLLAFLGGGIGTALLLGISLRSGTPGPNSYGSDPSDIY